MARKQQQVDMTGVEISAHLRKWGEHKGHLFVHMSARWWHDIAEIAEGRANVLAAKRGYKMLEGVQVSDIVQSTWDNRYECTRIYTMNRAK